MVYFIIISGQSLHTSGKVELSYLTCKMEFLMKLNDKIKPDELRRMQCYLMLLSLIAMM